jgi:hypothetical protein
MGSIPGANIQGVLGVRCTSRNRNVTDIIVLLLFLLKTPLIVCIVCWLRVIPKIKSNNIQCFVMRRRCGAKKLYYNRVNISGVRSQIWKPLSRLNRRTDGAPGQILCLPVVLNRPEGVAGCALRE